MARTRPLDSVPDAGPAPRDPRHAYSDPVDAVWLGTAGALGLRVERSSVAFAAYDGRGTLTIGAPETLDADDSLAQLVFHELCHGLVAGPASERSLDWGFGGDDAADLRGEHACQRLQAFLAGRHGLRRFMAPTTEHRAYYDGLPNDPLTDATDPAAALAREAWDRARAGRWLEVIDAALDATARIARLTAPFVDEASLWRTTESLHASGFPRHRDAALRCADCAWFFHGGPGRPVGRCRQTRGEPRSVARRVDTAEGACARWEPRLGEADCARCGACCHRGFDLAPVGARETLARRHPQLLVRGGHGLFLPRPDGRCVALEGDGAEAAYRCRVYADRPRACAELPVGGDACLAARQRVGLSA